MRARLLQVRLERFRDSITTGPRLAFVTAGLILGLLVLLPAGASAGGRSVHRSRPYHSSPRPAVTGRVLIAQLFVQDAAAPSTPAADPAQESSAMPTLERYWRALDQIKGSFYNPDSPAVPDETTLTYAAIRGVLSSLNDPYTRFLPPNQYTDMQRENRGTFPGIGVELRTEGNKVLIDQIIPNSPASAAGLLHNDEIVSVDSAPVSGKNTVEVGNLLKGEEGTQVTLVVLPNNNRGHTRTLTLTRREVSYPHFESRLINGDIGYMHLLMFDEQAADNIDKALASFRRQNVKGLIFDLRDNPGGLLNAAVDVASKFIRPGPVVYVQERGGQRNALPTTDDAEQHHLPLVVLVNHYSASASEIVSGAIQDTHSGTILGWRTWGKGLVQEIIPLNDDSAVALTTAHYFTPNGSDINLKGIMPDVVVGKALEEPDDGSDASQAAYDAEKAKVDAEQLDSALHLLKQKIDTSTSQTKMAYKSH